MAKKEIGITADKDDFSEWFTQIMLKADLADYSAVSGCIILKPSSYALWEKVHDEIDSQIKKFGVKNAYFPLFVPESLLKKEATHVKGFSPEVAWVTQGGDTKLAERLAVRPTSEAIMYDNYAKWIRSWRDLPLKLNQWNNVVRWEFKHPVPFLRTREFLWNEGHTVFATKKEAEAEMSQIIGMYSNFLKDFMALPGLIGKKTESEKFAGAEYTVTIELVLPNGKAIQGPDFHHDGQIFSKAYGIKFLNENGKEEYAWQNTWAITTRMIGVMLAIHSDNKGLIIPPKMATNQIVIVPILFDDTKEKVLKKAKEISGKLKEFNAFVDDRENYKPGFKFNDWELKGIPVRIEIGPKDIENNSVVIARRDSGEKETVKISDLQKKIPAILEDIQKSLYKKAEKHLKESIVKAESYEELKKAIENKKIGLIPYCGSSECEDWIKSETGGAGSRNIPFDQPAIKGKKCIHCKKDAKFWAYFGKSY
jgi:prolyl-tRNA synthetase